MTTSGTTLVYARPSLPIGTLPRPSRVEDSSVRALNLKVATANSGLPNVAPLPVNARDVRYTNDPEILRMSKAEYIAAIEALSGIWSNRDDISNDWVDEIRSEWDKRVDVLYGSSNSADNTSV